MSSLIPQSTSARASASTNTGASTDISASVDTYTDTEEGTAVPTRPRAAAVAGTLLAAVVLASLIDAVIAAVAHAAGASHSFLPLEPPSFIALTLLATLAGAAGWALVRRRSAHPAALLRKLVPAVLAVSFIPDLSMFAVAYEPHSNAAGIFGLLTMHVCVAAIAVTAYRRAFPVR